MPTELIPPLQNQWTAVDRYIIDRLNPVDPVLDAALSDSEAAGLPAINVTPALGKFLHLLAKVQNAKQILELGTLGGYSTIWLARALAPGGRLVTLEADPRHAEVARQNIARAKLDDIVELRLGPALHSLPRLHAEGHGPFDMIFIDADKENNAAYFEWALRLSCPGSLIIVDNVVRNGAVIDAASMDSRVQGVRRLFDLLAGEPRVSATALQTIGSKGYDGFILARVQ
jgi:predicted O-methyltransferase YrrM